MAQRDELAGGLGTHDPSNLRNAEHISLRKTVPASKAIGASKTESSTDVVGIGRRGRASSLSECTKNLSGPFLSRSPLRVDMPLDQVPPSPMRWPPAWFLFSAPSEAMTRIRGASGAVQNYRARRKDFVTLMAGASGGSKGAEKRYMCDVDHRCAPFFVDVGEVTWATRDFLGEKVGRSEGVR